MDDIIQRNNQRLLELMSEYLNEMPKRITTNIINKVMNEEIIEEQAYIYLLEVILNIDENKIAEDEFLINNYLPYLVNKLDPNEYMNDPYYMNIKYNKIKYQGWVIIKDKYDPYEAFVCDDFIYFSDGRVVPQIGYFNKPFYYPAVYYNNHLWMSITPNEINTMKKPIAEAHDIVLTIGLGLGYYAYMVSLKDNVKKVYIVEQDPNIITLFKKMILPQFKYKDKIEIINQDAFDFLDSDLTDYHINYMFIDIWYDARDGKELYLKLKPYEKKHPDIEFSYWIEDTIKYYL